MPYYLTIGEPYLDFEEDDFWNEEWGSEIEKISPMERGEKIDPAYLPKSGFLRNKAALSPLPLACRPYWLCNDEVKNIIESIDSISHQFIPIEIRKSKNGELFAEYYIINIISDVEALDTKRSNRKVVTLRYQSRKYDGGERAYIDSMELISDGDGIVLNADEIRHSHIWIDKKLGRYSEIFLSDEMYKALKKYINSKFIRAFKTN